MKPGTAKHILHRQVFDLECYSEEVAAKLQKEIPDLIADELVPELDKVFSGFSGDSGHFLIDRMEIDLGQVPLPEFRKAVAEKFISRLKDEISKIRSSDFTVEESLLPLSSKEIRRSSEGKTEESLLLNEEEIILSAFLYFLRNGIFPWYMHDISYTEMERTIEEYAERSPSFILQEFRNKISGSASFERMSMQFSHDFHFKMLQTLIAGNTEIISWFIENTIPGGKEKDSVSQKQFLTYFWQVLLQGEIPGDDLSLQKLPGSFPVEVTNWRKKRYLNDAQEEHGIRENRQSIHPGLGTEEVFSIENAGLILLSPFLERFFEVLGLYIHGEFIHQAAKEKALCLTHYLVTGKPVCEEHLLPLNKVMLDWPLNKTVNKEFHPTENESEECIELLRSVISHWAILKNTSVEGLREAFLLRKGRLEKEKNQGWILRVERKPHDLLLDHLPWSVGTIKLPWMNSFISTVW